MALVAVHRTRAAILPAAVGGGAAALIGLAALAGADYLNNRNTLPALAIALAVPALGFAAGRRAGAALGAAACVAMAVATVGALTDPAHAREDWRATARDLGAAQAVVVVAGLRRRAVALVPARPSSPAPPNGVEVTGWPSSSATPTATRCRPARSTLRPSPGFTPAGTTTNDRMLIARYRAAEPQLVTPDAVREWARTRLDAARGASGAALLAERTSTAAG